MAPTDFALARQEALAASTDYSGSFPSFSVEGRPYLPTLMAREGDLEAIRGVVGAIFQLSKECVDNLQVHAVSGGITNKLYHVCGISQSSADTAPPAVLVRIFGGAGLIDRDVETSTFSALGQQGIALRYYGRFGNGRLEEWLPNAHTLQVSEMPAYVDSLAQQLGRLHSRFVIPSELKHHHDPIAPPTLWTQLASWLEQAHKATFELPDDKDRVSALPLQHLADDLTWLQQEVCPKDAKVGFCHNDLLAANILCYDEGENRKNIQLIDFEYGGMNYLAYDIANHFNEYAGGTDTGTPNYSWFPSIQVQKRFCQAYLHAIGHAAAEDKDVDVLLTEIQGFVLANHLVWGLWAVNQAANEGCQEFDYLQYASCRMNRYFEEKAKWS